MRPPRCPPSSGRRPPTGRARRLRGGRVRLAAARGHRPARRSGAARHARQPRAGLAGPARAARRARGPRRAAAHARRPRARCTATCSSRRGGRASSCWSSAPQRLSQLDAPLRRPGFEYPYTLERALHAADAALARRRPRRRRGDASPSRPRRRAGARRRRPRGHGADHRARRQRQDDGADRARPRAAAPRRARRARSSPRPSTATRAIELAERLAAAGVRVGRGAHVPQPRAEAAARGGDDAARRRPASSR